MIRAAAGLTSEWHATRAAHDLAMQVRGRLDGARPDWCIAFVSDEHRAGLPALLSALSEAMETPYVTGCTTIRVLTGGREIESGPAAGCLAVAAPGIKATPYLFPDEGDHGLTAGIRLGQRMQGSRGTGDLVLAWPDPFHVRPDRLLQSLDAVLGPVPVVGAAASGRDVETGTLQFSGEEVIEDGVSGLRLAGSFRHVTGVTQGCRPLGAPLRVTRSHENLVLEVEGRPALDVLRELAPSERFDDFEQAFHYLFIGLVPESGDARVQRGEYLIRNIVEADPDTGLLAITERVGEGQSIVFAHREGGAARDDLRRMLREVSTERTGIEYRFGLYFDCLARGRSLYGEGGVDAGDLGRAFPGLPILGFACNAEIAPLAGLNQVLTYSGVLLLVGE